MSETPNYAPRIRAARAFADLEQGDLASTLNVSTRTLARIESGEKTPDGEIRRKIATGCDVPLDFIELGFAPMARPVGDVERRVLDLEQRVLTQRYPKLLAEVKELRGALIALVAGNLQLTREQLGLDDKGRPTAREEEGG